MRVYHFLSKNDALDDLERGRIKISKIDDLNDPFELWSAQGDARVLAALRQWKEAMARIKGILCFSRAWRNPMLWSHYAYRHRGICLGFDVDDKLPRAVNYVKQRTSITDRPTKREISDLLFTKYWGWSYEEEMRCWCDLTNCSGEKYFYPFDESVKVREVILGPFCGTPTAELDKVIMRYGASIRVVKSWLANRSFEIVEEREGFHRLR